MTTQDEMKKLWTKIILNSYYPIQPAPFIFNFDESTANQMIEDGIKIQEKLNKMLNK